MNEPPAPMLCCHVAVFTKIVYMYSLNDCSGYQHCLRVCVGVGGGGGSKNIVHNDSTTKLMATGHRYLEDINVHVHCKCHFCICLRKILGLTSLALYLIMRTTVA